MFFVWDDRLPGHDFQMWEVALCIMCTLEHVICVIGGTDSGSSWNWEFITRDHNYAAYRKYYQDTELFQYKVIGHYDDITARDFFEAQVNTVAVQYVPYALVNFWKGVSSCSHSHTQCSYNLFTENCL